MKSLHYRHSDNTCFLWQGPESGNEDIAQQVEEADRSAEKDKACSMFSGELGDLADLCANGKQLAPMDVPLPPAAPDQTDGDDSGMEELDDQERGDWEKSIAPFGQDPNSLGL